MKSYSVKNKQQKAFPCKQFTGKLDRNGDSYTLHSEIESELYSDIYNHWMPFQMIESPQHM